MEGFEKVRPSWQPVKIQKQKKSVKEIPRISFSSVLTPNNTSEDRIGLNKAATELLGLTASVKCELLINKKINKLAICILYECSTEDSLTISFSSKHSCIRRKGLFSMLKIPVDTIKYLREKIITSEITAEGNYFIASLPEKPVLPKEPPTTPEGIIVESDVLSRSYRKRRTTDMPLDLVDVLAGL